ncbi:zinc finger protein 892-like [Lytechinus pictus]|uniref:zinc finger protein 892-like n=1 Tax=Lytechinus pictus TaxID=7653 RepID=UPI0030B9EE62
MESPEKLKKGMDPLESAKGNDVIIKNEPPEFESASVIFDDRTRKVENQGAPSGSGICSNLSQRIAFSSVRFLDRRTVLREDSEVSGLHSSTIDGGSPLTGYQVPGVPQGALFGTTLPVGHSIAFSAPEYHSTSIGLICQEPIEEPQNRTKSYLSNHLGHGMSSSSFLQDNALSSEISTHNVAILRKGSEMFHEHNRKIDLKESIISDSRDERTEDVPMDLTVASHGVLQGALLGPSSTYFLSDKIKVEPEAHSTASSALDCQDSHLQVSSKNMYCSSSTLQSGTFSAQNCQITNCSSKTSQNNTVSLGSSLPTSEMKNYENPEAECMTSANIDENTMSNELPGVPQGALLCTTFSSNELRANHAMTSLEKTLELVRKRKNGLSNSEATSSKNMKRKRKPIKPTKSIQYCKETERLIKENLSSRALTASDETDQVMLMEDGSSTLGDEQFSPFFTEHQHSLLNFKQYQCLKCGQDFASRKAMNIHIQTHCEETPFWCTECNQSFTNNQSYMMHMQIHRPYECDDCGANCADSTTLHKHKLFRLDSKNFQCPLCPKVFKQRAGLACHRMNAHPEMASDIKPFWCAECNKGFTQNHSYKAHMRIHSGERPYLCKECGAAFADNKTLQNHKALHSDERTFKCTLCPKMFRQRAGLACHMKTHTDEKPFVCELCGQRVKTKSTLKNHLRIHSEEKPYKCPLCPQAFKQRAGLACHSKVHEKGNPV